MKAIVIISLVLFVGYKLYKGEPILPITTNSSSNYKNSYSEKASLQMLLDAKIQQRNSLVVTFTPANGPKCNGKPMLARTVPQHNVALYNQLTKEINDLKRKIR